MLPDRRPAPGPSILAALAILLVGACALPGPRRVAVSGRVVDTSTGQPLAAALVTVRATDHNTTSDADGEFLLSLPTQDGEVEVTAWAPGFYIGHTMTGIPAQDLLIELRPHHKEDNPAYTWLDPTPNKASEAACGNCHPAILPQWQANAHGGAIANARFYSLYNGTTLDGGSIQGTGYLLDFPGTSGSCANCHAPGAAIDQPFNTDMNAVRGELTAGIHCDFCHKVSGPYLQPGLSTPYANAPGVMSMRVLRPPAGEQIFIGPFPDIHDPDTYSPAMAESAFCAPCHQFSFWGTPIYNSYGEWLESSYAAAGVTCQDCHMPPTGDTTFALPEAGGLVHPPETIPSHLQLGVANETLMREAIALELDASSEEGVLTVEARVTNTGAGHHYPTDHPGRHLLLVIEANGAQGEPLALLEGSTVQDWGGNLAQSPGEGYALILQDVGSGAAPVVSYWKQAVVRADTRIPANSTAMGRWKFQSDSGPVEVTARLVFRRMFEPLAQAYGWDLGEILLHKASLILEGE